MKPNLSSSLVFPSLLRINYNLHGHLTWIGDAVPGLVVNISCQRPSIKLDPVCRYSKHVVVPLENPLDQKF